MSATGSGLRVGFLCQGWWPQPGGIEAHTRDLARGLFARGHSVFVLCLDRENHGGAHAVSTAHEDGIEVRRMRPTAAHRSLADLVADPGAEDVVRAWRGEARCDVVHVHHLSGFGAGALEALADGRTPTVLTLHDHWLACPCGQLLHDAGEPSARLTCIRSHWPHLLPSGGGEPRGPRGELVDDDATAVEACLGFVRAAVARPRVVLAPSPSTFEALAVLGLDTGRTRVVAHGLDAAALATAVGAQRAAHPRAANDLVRLGVLGSVLPGKGVDVLLEAFLAGEANHLAVEVHGPLVGFHGDERHLERVRDLAARSERVSLHGAYAPADLPRILAGLDAVAAPSVWDEVFGLSVREARAAGLPVLVSDRGGLPAAAQAGLAGRVLPAGDVAAWALALDELARPDGPRARWAAQPPDLRGVAAMAADHEAIYREALRAAT